MNAPLNYPAGPANVPASITEPSPQFKKEVSRVIGSIILFFLVYIALVFLAVVFAAVCVYGGIAIIIALPRFITLMLGAGLVGLGLSLVFFLIKFVFAVNKNEKASRIQVTEEEQPQLFAFIRQLSADTQTQFPKKIFLSPDVNAAVFYNSSFWSMFFPVRKNLEIGLGLVNTVNLSEFKAVVAHEFGHFSQRSMKLGSFTYNVNRIIYNMLFENNSFNNFLAGWGKIHGAIALFVSITVSIANGIRSILKEMYEVINKSYMGLSRQMEFHADAIAASVAGGNNLITALRRSEVANACYNISLNKAGDALKNKCVATNIYKNQSFVLKVVAQLNKLETVNDLPLISNHFSDSISTSRINFDDQYASHPARKDREVNLESLGVNIDPVDVSAWSLFNDAEGLQKRMTENLYLQVELPSKEELQLLDEKKFEEEYINETNEFSLPDEYNGYFDGRIIKSFELSVEPQQLEEAKNSFDELFNNTTTTLPKLLKNNEADLQTAKGIAEGHIKIKTFDFDGAKFKADEAETVVKQLENEIAEIQEKIDQNDKEAFIYFYREALNTSPSAAAQLQTKYKDLFSTNTMCEAYFDNAANIIETCNTFYQQQLPIETITSLTNKLKVEYEAALKKFWTEVLDQQILTPQNNAELHQSITSFLSKYYPYFANQEFHNDELHELYTLTIQTGEFINNYRFKKLKSLLEYQLDLIKVPA